MCSFLCVQSVPFRLPSSAPKNRPRLPVPRNPAIQTRLSRPHARAKGMVQRRRRGKQGLIHPRMRQSAAQTHPAWPMSLPALRMKVKGRNATGGVPKMLPMVLSSGSHPLGDVQGCAIGGRTQGNPPMTHPHGNVRLNMVIAVVEGSVDTDMVNPMTVRIVVGTPGRIGTKWMR